jgi:hypothetical protein
MNNKNLKLVDVYSKESRKLIVCKLYRNILKSVFKFKKFDEFIFDYLKIYIRHRFRKNISLFKSSEIVFQLKLGHFALEDFNKFDLHNYNHRGFYNLIVSCFYEINTLEHLIDITYGQVGQRRSIFLVAKSQQVNDVLQSVYQRRMPWDHRVEQSNISTNT